MKKYTELETKLIHAGESRPGIEGSVAMPVFQTAMYEYGGEKGYHNVRYIRLNNTPNHKVLHEKLAALENGEDALVTSSGMSAISSSLLTFLPQGSHLLVQDSLYGGTHDFVTKDLPLMGVEHTFINICEPESWKSLLKKNTKVIYVESISNPMVRVGDLNAIVAFAKTNNLISMIDNTFASPVNFKPIDYGFDLSLHSCTKYLNGHSDIVAGCVIGKHTLVEKVTHKVNHLGGTLDPHACFLLNRGMKTLALRVRYQNESALEIARFLSNHPKVEKVYYPGLESDESHPAAATLLKGYGGMLSFTLNGDETYAENFIKNLTIPIHAPSLGSVETLITRPSTTSHAGLSEEARQKLGITDRLIRMSIGIESTSELIADITKALDI